MAACSVLKRSVLDVDGKSFDVVLSHTSLSWGHVGIEDYGLGKEMKHFYDVSNVSWRTYCQQQIFFPFTVISNSLRSNIAKQAPELRVFKLPSREYVVGFLPDL